MNRPAIFILLAAFCFLIPFTLGAQSYATPSYTASSDGSYGQPVYGEKTETYGYVEPTYKEETYKESYGYSEPTYHEPTYGYTEPTYHEETYKEETYKEESYGYVEPTYHEETYKEESYSYGEKTEKSSYYAPPLYGASESYEEEYSSYTNENYNYNNGSYGGSSSNYSKPSTSYGSSQGYTGSYDGSNPSNVPKFPTSLLVGLVFDIHIVAVNPHFQYVAYHYCSELYPGYTQCAIYNGTASNSALIAVEIIVSAEIFVTLPMEERKLYHSHAFSAKNGLLVVAGVSAEQEQSVYEGVATTYGKVVNFWHSWETYPTGQPLLDYGLGAMVQLDVTVAEEMDKAINDGTTWKQRQSKRANYKMPTPIEGADDYLDSGVYPQYVVKQFSVSASDE